MGIKARKDEASKKLLDLSMDAPRSPEIALSKYLNGASQLQISRILSDKAISEAAAERLSKEHALGELFSGLVLRDYFGAVDDAAFGRFVPDHPDFDHRRYSGLDSENAEVDRAIACSSSKPNSMRTKAGRGRSAMLACLRSWRSSSTCASPG